MKTQAFVFYVLENIRDVEEEIEREMNFDAQWSEKLQKQDEIDFPIEDDNNLRILTLEELMQIL